MNEDIDIVEIDYVLLDTWQDRKRANEQLAAGWRLHDTEVPFKTPEVCEGCVRAVTIAGRVG